MAKNLNKSKNLEKATPTYNVGAASKSRIAKEKEKEKNKGAGIALFFLLLVIIGVSIGILFSPMFNLAKVIVKDGVNVSSGEILNTIDVSYGENILKQKFKTIKQKVSAIPYVKDVNLRLLLPDKIEIKYEERVPYMLISYLESYLVVDKQGVLLEIKKENDLEELPIIYGIELDDYELGKMLDDTANDKRDGMFALTTPVITSVDGR